MPCARQLLLGPFILLAALVGPAAAQVLRLSPEAAKAFDAGEFRPCIEEATLYLATAPRSDAALAQRARCRFQATSLDGEIARVMQEFRATRAQAMDTANKNYAGVLRGVLADADAALAINPGNATAHNMRGLVLDRSDRRAEAIAEYTQAIALDVKYWQPVMNRALARRASGDFPGALGDLAVVAAARPTFEGVPAARAEIYAQQKKLDLAVEEINKAITLKPNDVGQLIKRSDYQLQRANYAASVADLKTAIGMRPPLLTRATQLGDALMAAKKPAGAVGFYDLVVANQPASAQALVKRADALAASGAAGAAIADLTKAMTIDPDSADPHAAMVTLLVSQNRAQDASAVLEAALRRFPFDGKLEALAALTPASAAQLDRVKFARYKAHYQDVIETYEKLHADHQSFVAAHDLMNRYTRLWMVVEDAQRGIKIESDVRYAAIDLKETAQLMIAILQKSPQANAAEIVTLQTVVAVTDSRIPLYGTGLANAEAQLRGAQAQVEERVGKR